MSQASFTIAVTAEERRIISALRDLPASPLRDLLSEVMSGLVEFVREPSCAEMQADGVPCAAPDADCEQCRRLKEVLLALRARFPVSS
jgi:hypothetical protein